MTQIKARRLIMGGGLLACVLALAVSAFLEAQPLPDRLSDAEFWKMVSDFSEPGGSFRFENFLSNEIEYQRVIPFLVSAETPGGVYLGVGPEQNFTYLSALRPKMAFIIDIRRQNMVELMMYKALFEIAEDRADFVSRLFSRKRPAGLNARSTADELFRAYRAAPADKELYGATIASVKTLLVNQHKFNLSAKDLADMDRVFSVFLESGPGMDYSSGGSFTGGWSMPTYAELMTADDRAAIPVNRSYLASEENYRAIRDLQRNNLIVPLVGDFAGPKAIRAVAEYLRGHNATVTAFYLSNVEQYLFNDGVERKFYENVATLPLDSSSRFIRTFGPASGGGGFGGFSFDTETAAIQKDIAAFKEGRVSSYYDLRNLSH